VAVSGKFRLDQECYYAHQRKLLIDFSLAREYMQDRQLDEAWAQFIVEIVAWWRSNSLYVSCCTGQITGGGGTSAGGVIVVVVAQLFVVVTNGHPADRY
jgi:hypothetical protein